MTESAHDRCSAARIKVSASDLASFSRRFCGGDRLSSFLFFPHSIESPPRPPLSRPRSFGFSPRPPPRPDPPRLSLVEFIVRRWPGFDDGGKKKKKKKKKKLPRCGLFADVLDFLGAVAGSPPSPHAGPWREGRVIPLALARRPVPAWLPPGVAGGGATKLGCSLGAFFVFGLLSGTNDGRPGHPAVDRRPGLPGSGCCPWVVQAKFPGYQSEATGGRQGSDRGAFWAFFFLVESFEMYNAVVFVPRPPLSRRCLSGAGLD